VAISANDLRERVQSVLALPEPHGWSGTVPAWLGMPSARGLAPFVDHTLLRPDATEHDILQVAHEGRTLGVTSVCVNGRWVRAVAEVLRGSPVAACAVVGFPLGAMTSRIKAEEAAHAVADGAREVDMVQSIGEARSGAWLAVAADVALVRRNTEGVVLKVILETALLSPEAIVAASLVAQDAGADFVKTSTGFAAAGGATEHAVGLMRRAVGPTFGVKASGGIRSAEIAIRMLAAGANRLGMSGTAVLGALLGAGAPTLPEIFARVPDPAPAPAGLTQGQ
jgi:deoxyribose-phosphate aldolase